MEELDKLINWIKSVRDGKLVIACIGTELRCDDIVGLAVCLALNKYCSDKVVAIDCPGGLELCTHRIIEEKPTYLLLVDGVLAGLEPGETVFTCDIETIEDFTPVTTHHIPLSISAKYIKTVTPSIKSICLLGIQVERLDLGEKPSSKVLETAKKIAETLCSLLLSE